MNKLMLSKISTLALKQRLSRAVIILSIQIKYEETTFTQFPVNIVHHNKAEIVMSKSEWTQLLDHMCTKKGYFPLQA